MMESRPQQHLNHDELLKSLVDAADLGDEQRTHLAGCTICQHEQKRIEQRFARMGRMAKTLAPTPGRSFRLPEQQTSSVFWRFKPLWVTGLVAAMIGIFTLWWPQRFAPPVSAPQLAQQRYEADTLLMEEIDALVENALPASYQELAAATEMDVTEDLINWVVPPIQEEDDDSLT